MVVAEAEGVHALTALPLVGLDRLELRVLGREEVGRDAASWKKWQDGGQLGQRNGLETD